MVLVVEGRSGVPSAGGSLAKAAFVFRAALGTWLSPTRLNADSTSSDLSFRPGAGLRRQQVSFMKVGVQNLSKPTGELYTFRVPYLVRMKSLNCSFLRGWRTDEFDVEAD